jgi:hypothetical protein
MKAKLIIDFDKQVTIGDGVTTIGRASDNQISFADDSNISRYHAEIETRGEDFWLIELGSSNGTKINGEIISSERRLNNGDLILFGGTSQIEFFLESRVESRESREENPKSEIETPKVENQSSENSETKKKFPMILAVAAIACGLAIVSIFAVVFYFSMETECKAEAKIVGIENGLTLTEPTQINLDLKGGNCIKRVIYMLNGEPIASETTPFSTTINPNDFGNLADGGTHVLTVALEDDKGKRTLQPSNILLAFETAEIKKKDTPEIVQTETPNPIEPNQIPVNIDNKQVSLADTQEMCRRLTKQFSGNFVYKLDPPFIQAVQAKTAEFRSEGYFSRASQFQDSVNVAFVKDNQLDASLGYFLAMSRSQFKNEKRGNNEGLWQISSDFATANGYGGACETLNLSDKDCSAKVASLYLKNIVVKIFDGDTIYGVSVFGMTEQEANDFKLKLPADRSNIWQVIKNQKQKDEVIRFFAAGIVAENPQKFGLNLDKPIHELYDFTMTK